MSSLLKTTATVRFPAFAKEGASNSEYGSRLSVEQGSYLKIPFDANSADGAYALESCCHAPGPDKLEFLAELHRVLKPGARFAVADGFCKTTESEQPIGFRKMVNWCCDLAWKSC